MSLTPPKAAGRSALCVLALAGAPAAAQPSAPALSPTTAPLPRAFAGYAQPAIPPTTCHVVSAGETRCVIPGMTAGRYLIQSSGTATAKSAGARQQIEIVVGDQLCGVGRDLTAWSSGVRTFTFDCLATILTDKPLEVRAVYVPTNATKDPKGLQVAIRALGWNGVLSTLPFAPSH